MFSNADDVAQVHRRPGREVHRRPVLRPARHHAALQRAGIAVDEDFFVNGQMFDGSSIRGFQAINESDMKLIPDLTTAYVDPFRAEKTLNVNFSIVDPYTDEPYSRDPRQVARKAEAYLRVDRHRRHRVLRARGRVLRLRRRPLRDEAERGLLLHRLHRGRLEHRAGSRRAATAATRRGTRAGTSPCRRSTTTPTCATRSSSRWTPSACRSSARTTRSARPARPRSTTGSTRC